MKIRTRLTIQFAVIVAGILLLGSITVYYFSAQYRQQEFYSRLRNKAVNTARLLIEVQEVSTDLLKIIDRNTVVLPNEKVMVYNNLDELVYTSNDDDSAAVPAGILAQVRKEKEIRFNDGEREVLAMMYNNSENHFVVLSYAHDVYGIRKITNLRFILIVVFFGSLVITVVAGWFFAGQSLKPISKVVNQVENISARNLDARVDEGNKKDEIAQLAITFNKMLGRLEQAFRVQKSFVSNASHELRTPLTSVKSQIEVTLIKDREPDQYQGVLKSVLEDINNMSRLSNGLLDLAQVDLENAVTINEEVRVDELIWQISDEIKSVHPVYRMSINYGIINGEERFAITANEQLLKSAITNVMENACKYSNDSQVSILINETESGIELLFTDNGPGISEEDLKYIKEPFYRSRHTAQIKGHGLGLSLTDRIIALHGGKLEITSVYGRGTRVSISLPFIQQFKTAN